MISNKLAPVKINYKFYEHVSLRYVLDELGSPEITVKEILHGRLFKIESEIQYKTLFGWRVASSYHFGNVYAARARWVKTLSMRKLRYKTADGSIKEYDARWDYVQFE